MRVTARDRTAYGTRFNAAALELLPQSGGVYGLIERSDPLVVTERMEGGGTYPEPQRLGASGASWTQTTFKLGDADITDPDRTGYAMLYPNLDALEAVSVATAGIHPDTYGAGTAVTLVPRMPVVEMDAHRAVRYLAAGVSVGEPAPGGRLHRPAAQLERRLVRGERPGDRRLGIQVAGALSEYDAPRARAGRHVAQPARGACPRTWCTRRSSGDDVRLFAQKRSPVVSGRSAAAMLVDPALAAARADRRCSPPPGIARRAPGSPGRRTLTYAARRLKPALAGDADHRAPWSACATARSYELAHRRARAASPDVAANGAASRARVNWLGLRHLPEFGASVSWTGVDAAGAGRLDHRRAGGRRTRAGVGVHHRRRVRRAGAATSSRSGRPTRFPSRPAWTSTWAPRGDGRRLARR